MSIHPTMARSFRITVRMTLQCVDKSCLVYSGPDYLEASGDNGRMISPLKCLCTSHIAVLQHSISHIYDTMDSTEDYDITITIFTIIR